MMLSSCLNACRRWFSKRSSRPAARRARPLPTTRLHLEGLEERVVPAGLFPNGDIPLSNFAQAAPINTNTVNNQPNLVNLTPTFGSFLFGLPGFPSQPTMTTLFASSENVSQGQSTTLTANVIGMGLFGDMPLSGTVTFYDGNTVLGTAVLNDGIASLNVTLPIGLYNVTAQYNGSTMFGQTFSSSISNTIAIDVNSGLSGTLTVPDPNSGGSAGNGSGTTTDPSTPTIPLFTMG